MRLNTAKLREMMRDRRITQTGFARLSGLSRGTIARVLGDDTINVQPRTVEKLSSALGVPPGALDREGVQTAYLERVAQQHACLDLTGLGIIAGADPMPMDRGYAPMHVREWREDRRCAHGDEGPPGRGAPGPREPNALAMASALVRSRRLFLLGDPGCGKTTALRHLARIYAAGRQEEASYPPESLIPVFVRLADWAQQLGEDADVGVLDAAVTQLSVPDPPRTSEWLAHQAARGTILLLLDGLDEVADPDGQARVIERIRSFAEAHRDAWIVISSRLVGFETPNLGARFDRLAAEPLEKESIRDFAREWCAFRHGHDSKRQCAECSTQLEGLRHAIMDHPRIRPLAGNPMMLTILILLHEAGAALPQRRCELYQRITEAFLFSWEQKKRGALTGAPDRALRIEDRELLWILESLALEMQRHDWTLVKRWWLSRHISSFLRDELSFEADEAGAEADTLIWSLQERSGILLERGPERFGFSHLAFQEYFAARGVLGSDDPIQALRPYFYHPRWREVVRLTAAQLDRRRAPQLLRMILDDPDPTGRFLRRALLTVLACLGDGAPLHERALLNQIFKEAADLGATKWLGLPLDAIRSLGQMTSGHFRQEAAQAAAKMILTAEKSLPREDAQRLFLAVATEGLLGDGQDSQADEDDGLPEHTPPAQPVWIEKVPLLGEKVEMVFAAAPGGYDAEWVAAVLNQLRQDPSSPVRVACAGVLERLVRRAKVRRGLLAALETENERSCRQRIAKALSEAATYSGVRQKLLQALDNDPAPDVRAACASALGRAVGHRAGVRRKLVSILRSEAPAPVRAGAAQGLSGCAAGCEEVRDLLLATLKSEDEDDEVRTACLWSLEGVLPSLPGELRFAGTLLSGDIGTKLTRVAAQILAQYAAAGRVAWRELPIEKIEHVLVSLSDPCPHALDALRALVDARELRKLGIPRTARIRRALSDVEGQIRVMFIFGSSARGEQDIDSDIDLMVIGDVSLRDLTAGLKRAEQELGRAVNVVIYSPDEFCKRRREKDAFITNVLKDKKDFAVGDDDELTAMG